MAKEIRKSFQETSDKPQCCSLYQLFDNVSWEDCREILVQNHNMQTVFEFNLSQSFNC